MPVQAVLIPVLAQVALTFVLLFWMGFSRRGSVKRGESKIADVALGQMNWPAKVQQISNCFHNQLQLPVLFYVLTVLALIARQADALFVTMAWLFVLLRLLHAYIHTGSNFVRHRFNAFLAGAIVLLAMWVIFAVRILIGLP